MTTSNQRAMTVRATSQYLRVSPHVVRDWIAEGQLDAVDLDGRIRILPEALDEFLGHRRIVSPRGQKRIHEFFT